MPAEVAERGSRSARGVSKAASFPGGGLGASGACDRRRREGGGWGHLPASAGERVPDVPSRTGLSKHPQARARRRCVPGPQSRDPRLSPLVRASDGSCAPTRRAGPRDGGRRGWRRAGGEEGGGSERGVHVGRAAWPVGGARYVGKIWGRPRLPAVSRGGRDGGRRGHPGRMPAPPRWVNRGRRWAGAGTGRRSRGRPRRRSRRTGSCSRCRGRRRSCRPSARCRSTRSR